MPLCFQFFVASDPTVKTDRLWHDKYTLRKSMIPSFITMDQSRKVGLEEIFWDFDILMLSQPGSCDKINLQLKFCCILGLAFFF